MFDRRACYLFLLTSGLMAQQAFEVNGQVVYTNAAGNRTTLGLGFNPLVTADGRIVFLSGRRFGYGDPFECGKKEGRNWVAVYSPATGTTETLFGKALPFDGLEFCIFEQMQLSPDGSILYLVAPVYATAGSLAIVQLAWGSVAYVPGVNSVYVIWTGPHKGELIYQRRTWRESQPTGFGHPAYPFIHARADGRQIAVISDEYFTNEHKDRVPILRRYLRKIAGTITIEGQTLP